MSYAFTDLDSGEEKVLVCTGDTLFVNDVGRTDFGGVNKRKEWSEALYDSIHNKLLPLGDHVILCPAHGEGSVCGGNIADREWSTLGLERLTNPLLQESKKMFVEYKTKEHHEYMPYFRTMEKYNVEGAPFVGEIPEPKAFTPKEFREKMDEGAVIVDTRSPIAFAGGHIKFSYNIPMKRLAMIGWFLPCETPLLLIASNQTNLDYVNKSLLQIGYDNVRGYLKDGLDSWSKTGYPFEHVGLLTVTELKAKLEAGEPWNLLDVRSKEEYEEGHIKDIKHIYVGVLEKHLNEVSKKGPIVVICKTGKRSAIASSILLRAGYSNVYNLLGGMEAWKTVEDSL
jgi:hydroxyacylglutathione hydrolase